MNYTDLFQDISILFCRELLTLSVGCMPWWCVQLDNYALSPRYHKRETHHHKSHSATINSLLNYKTPITNIRLHWWQRVGSRTLTRANNLSLRNRHLSGLAIHYRIEIENGIWKDLRAVSHHHGPHGFPYGPAWCREWPTRPREPTGILPIVSAHDDDDDHRFRRSRRATATIERTSLCGHGLLGKIALDGHLLLEHASWFRII